jgi:hypothetical protein
VRRLCTESDGTVTNGDGQGQGVGEVCGSDCGESGVSNGVHSTGENVQHEDCVALLKARPGVDVDGSAFDSWGWNDYHCDMQLQVGGTIHEC